jgi:uncharacterized protein YciI
MPVFAVECLDRPSSNELRAANRDAHVAYMQSLGSRVRLAGPLLNDAGEPIGSLLLIEAGDAAALQSLLAADPYVQAGLFESSTVREMNLEPGAG